MDARWNSPAGCHSSRASKRRTPRGRRAADRWQRTRSSRPAESSTRSRSVTW
ncbi:hypothetical protein FEK31_26335 [Nocardia cyriacigeorgica]|nr:hypothetical protein FEK31_26335 [Nocardia cyriacigeorgica]